MDEKIPRPKRPCAELETIYQQILVLSRDLRDLCEKSSFPEEGDLEKLAGLLLGREELMEETAAGQKETSPREQRLREPRGLSRPELLLKEIVALDAASGQALKRSLQHMAGEMKKIQKGKKASKTYRDQDYQLEGFFVDFNS